MNNETYINMWLNTVKSANTHRAYRRIVTNFLESLGNPDITSVSRIEILNWKQNLTGSSATRQQAVMCIKSLYKFLYNNDITETNLADRLKADVVRNKKKDALNMEEVKEMMKYANPREKAILVFTTQTGLRASEVASITYSQFLNYNSELGMEITTKGDKPRVVYLTDSTIDFINRYLPTRKAGCDKLFVSNNGTPMVEKNLNTMIQKLARKTGTTKHWTFHSLRACAVTTMYEATHDIIACQKYIGHSSPSVTIRYIRQDDKNKELASLLNF